MAGVSEEVVMSPLLVSSPNVAGASWSFRQARTGAGVSVAVIDDGVAAHSFLGDRVVQEFCVSAPSTDGTFTSVCRGSAWLDVGPGSSSEGAPEPSDHGTHVAGIVAGDGSGMAGMARRAGIVAINATSLERGSAPPNVVFLWGNVLAAMELVLDVASSRNVVAVNLSLGGSPDICGGRDENFHAVRDVAALLRAAGVATVAAAGNSSEANAIDFPACVPGVISVGAVDDSGAVAEFSSSGAGLGLLAPGVAVVSSVTTGFDSYEGTSMAAPHVSGALALLREAFPDASIDELEAALRVSGRPVTDARQGRVTPLIQVEAAMGVLGPPYVSFYPESGNLLAPAVIDANVHGGGRDMAAWLTTNGQEPRENGAGAVRLDGLFGYNTVTLDRPGPVTVQARAFFTLPDGTRVGGPITRADYVIRPRVPGPATVIASDGEFPGRVRVRWSAVAGAQGYEVFLSSIATDPDRFAVRVGSAPGSLTEFDYTGAGTTGDEFYYYVRAIVDGDPTLFGGPDLGRPQIAAIPVTASDGTEPAEVRLTWDPTPWKTPGITAVYEVYRGTGPAASAAGLLARVEGTFINEYPAGVVIRPAAKEYVDRQVMPGQVYYYWVKGIDAGAVSALGAGEPGHAAAP